MNSFHKLILGIFGATELIQPTCFHYLSVPRLVFTSTHTLRL